MIFLLRASSYGGRRGFVRWRRSRLSTKPYRPRRLDGLVVSRAVSRRGAGALGEAREAVAVVGGFGVRGGLNGRQL